MNGLPKINASGKLRQRLTEYKYLPLILMLSLTLNLWGNRWGAPNFWHPDEVIRRSISMVSKRTLNPGHFAYGGLHYSILAAGAVIPGTIFEHIFDPKPSRSNTADFAEWKERHLVRIIVMARSISAVMSTLMVGITFMIGTVLFDRKVGYLAAILLAVSVSFVAIAHFATVDAPANFWYWLSCLFALLIWKRGDRTWYILAAITAGFAIGTKVDRLVILIPLLTSCFLRHKGIHLRRLLPFTILIPASFVLTNPTLITAFFEFLDGFTRDLFFITLRGQPGQTSFKQVIGYMNSGMGLPLFATVLAGFAHALYDLAHRKNPARILWLLAAFVPYYFVIGSRPHTNSWYIPLLFPPLVILTAYGCIEATTRLPQRYTNVVISAMAAITTYSLLNVLVLVSNFSRDTRYQAGEWINHNVPANSTIKGMRRSMVPEISGDEYHLIETLPDKDARVSDIRTLRRLESNRNYQRIRQVILDLEQWGGRRLGFPVRDEPYRAWFDRVAAQYEKLPDKTSSTVAIQHRQPDYVVIIKHKQRRTLAALKSPNSGYRLVAEFRVTGLFGFQPSFPFVSPHLYIFQREIEPFSLDLHQPFVAHASLHATRLLQQTAQDSYSCRPTFG